MVKKDYYLILGIPCTASAGRIRAAYRQLVKRYPPDRVGPQATLLLQNIVEAYEVLSEEESRRLYNRARRHDAEGREGAESEPIIVGRGPAPEPLVPERTWSLRDYQTVRPSAAELLERLLRNFTHAYAPKGERAEGLNVDALLSWNEAARGAVARFAVPVFASCPTCGGSGRDWLCPCMSCGAQGMVAEDEVVRVEIPPMVRDGTVLEVPLRRLGIHNFYLRVHVRIARWGLTQP